MKEGTPDAITPSDWIIQNMKPNSAIGFDPQLFGIGNLLEVRIFKLIF